MQCPRSNLRSRTRRWPHGDGCRATALLEPALSLGGARAGGVERQGPLGHNDDREQAADPDAAAQAGLQSALALKLEREQTLGAKRSEYDDLTAGLAADEPGCRQALQSWCERIATSNRIDRNLSEVREAIHFRPNP